MSIDEIMGGGSRPTLALIGEAAKTLPKAELKKLLKFAHRKLLKAQRWPPFLTRMWRAALSVP